MTLQLVLYRVVWVLVDTLTLGRRCGVLGGTWAARLLGLRTTKSNKWSSVAPTGSQNASKVNAIPPSPSGLIKSVRSLFGVYMHLPIRHFAKSYCIETWCVDLGPWRANYNRQCLWIMHALCVCVVGCILWGHGPVEWFRTWLARVAVNACALVSWGSQAASNYLEVHVTWTQSFVDPSCPITWKSKFRW